jgi:hypothetical protein
LSKKFDDSVMYKKMTVRKGEKRKGRKSKHES